MLNQQNPEVTLPSPQFYDRSLKTMDIRGAYPNKPWIKQEVFENRSLFTNDIKGAQPKISIRPLNYPNYDPSQRIQGFENTNFSRTPDINVGNYQNQRAQSNRQDPILSQSIQDRQFNSSVQNNNLRASVPAPMSSQQFNQASQSSYSQKQPYQGIQGFDVEKSSYYNGPIADRIHKPHNQPPSYIQKDQLLSSPTYQQMKSDQIRGVYPQQNVIPKSPQPYQVNGNIPQSYLNRPASNPNIPTQNIQKSQQLQSPTYAYQNNQNANGAPNTNNRGYSSSMQNNLKQLDYQQQKFQQSIRPPSNTNIAKDDVVEDFKHTALIRPNHYDSNQKYQEFKHNIESRIVSPKHYDIPDKMVQYQMNKDNIFSYQQPKLKINREKMERYNMSKSAMTKNQFISTSSTPNLIKNNFGYQPTPTQQVYQSQDNNYGQLIKPQPLIQSQQAGQYQQGDILRKIPTAQSRPKTNQQNQENKQSQYQSLQSQISPKHSLIERNIFQKPQSAGPQKDKLSYLKPYTVVPKVDNSSEYTTKFNQSPIEQLQKSITPAPKVELTKVPWNNKQQDYNVIGNYVQEKRLYNKTDLYGKQVDKYFKNYDGGSILNMRKEIHETGDQIPYEVKFKYEKTKDNYYTVESAPRVKNVTSSYLNPSAKSFAAGKSDLFQVQTYKSKDPVGQDQFHYASKPLKNQSTSNLIY
ncbi:hypothetical protein TTHERM_00716090 (macronuclear) [Tetrahymena thermophila SB210]|uniref:Uncharacterized protein n=1 Tax=Tetrahymena thermophila (strain SB210) TaxID=312017 RepID=I7MFU3_TETTS|nr:hypothetical protein TTHERM_00716090 [Tetrahymena thermophila SB210]EAR84303.2 hypothetical protein TTHERM_00716090 [Tetrahymena thermophila SB210]|eukprot:XP_001031966.2 hypothetical protein TTHERM_00716090 [Tetrahymena thermophila SB210]